MCCMNNGGEGVVGIGRKQQQSGMWHCEWAQNWHWTIIELNKYSRNLLEDASLIYLMDEINVSSF